MWVTCLVIASGCGQSVSADAPSISASALVGRWTATVPDLTETWEFREDGTLTNTSVRDSGTVVTEGLWELEGSQLTTVIETSRPLGEQTVVERSEQSFTSTVADDSLYMGVFLRTVGSGPSLVGTWSYQGREIWTETTAGAGEDSVERTADFVTMTLAISGEQASFEANGEETVDRNGTRIDDTTQEGQTRGTVSVDGVRVLLTASETSGQPATSFEIGVPGLVGFRVHDDVIATHWHETAEGTFYAFERQRDD